MYEKHFHLKLIKCMKVFGPSYFHFEALNTFLKQSAYKLVLCLLIKFKFYWTYTADDYHKVPDNFPFVLLQLGRFASNF